MNYRMNYTKVNVIFAVEWTTEAVEKEPEKIQAWPGIKPTVEQVIVRS